MLKINSNKFNFQFFLSDSKKVKSLKSGALTHGGATRTETGIYSNIQGSDFIQLNNTNNKLAIFIPSTLDINKQVNNSSFIDYAVNFIQSNFKNTLNLKFYKTKGSWYSEDLQKVVYDKITLISFESAKITITDINTMVILANYIKQHMYQEGVSININNALAII